MQQTVKFNQHANNRTLGSQCYGARPGFAIFNSDTICCRSYIAKGLRWKKPRMGERRWEKVRSFSEPGPARAGPTYEKEKWERFSLRLRKSAVTPGRDRCEVMYSTQARNVGSDRSSAERV